MRRAVFAVRALAPFSAVPTALGRLQVTTTRAPACARVRRASGEKKKNGHRAATERTCGRRGRGGVRAASVSNQPAGAGVGRAPRRRLIRRVTAVCSRVREFIAARRHYNIDDNRPRVQSRRALCVFVE